MMKFRLKMKANDRVEHMHMRANMREVKEVNELGELSIETCYIEYQGKRAEEYKNVERRQIGDGHEERRQS